jgi:hypothetical protein
MPFTLSHVIAVLPIYKISKKYFSISGLIIGSMAPDFEFFIRYTLYAIWSHTFMGIFLFDLPISLILCFVFHSWVRDKLIIYLPSILGSKYSKYYKFSWNEYFKKHYLIVIISIFVGIFTHFAWDNLTHEPNYISPIYFDFLLTELSMANLHIPLYNILQALSSIIGLAGLLYTVYSRPSSFLAENKSFSEKVKFWSRYSIFVLTIFIGRYVLGVPDEKPIGQLIVVSISSCLYGLVVLSIIYPMCFEKQN